MKTICTATDADRERKKERKKERKEKKERKKGKKESLGNKQQCSMACMKNKSCKLWASHITAKQIDYFMKIH